MFAPHIMPFPHQKQNRYSWRDLTFPPTFAKLAEIKYVSVLILSHKLCVKVLYHERPRSCGKAKRVVSLQVKSASSSNELSYQ